MDSNWNNVAPPPMDSTWNNVAPPPPADNSWNNSNSGCDTQMGGGITMDSNWNTVAPPPPADSSWNNSNSGSDTQMGGGNVVPPPPESNSWNNSNSGSDTQMGGGDSSEQWSARERSPRRQWNQGEDNNSGGNWNRNDSSGGSWNSNDNSGDKWKRDDNSGGSWNSNSNSGGSWNKDDNSGDKWKNNDSSDGKWNNKSWGSGGGGWKKDWRDDSRPTGDWDCPSCSFSNFARNKKCKKCGTLRPGLAAEEGEQEDEETKKKDSLVRAIKTYQRVNDDNTETWYWFCDVNKFRDKYDPGRKPVEFLEDFVAAMKVPMTEENSDSGKGDGKKGGAKGGKGGGKKGDTGKGKKGGQDGGLAGLPNMLPMSLPGLNLGGATPDMDALLKNAQQLMAGMPLPPMNLPGVNLGGAPPDMDALLKNAQQLMANMPLSGTMPGMLQTPGSVQGLPTMPGLLPGLMPGMLPTMPTMPPM